jgi:hypothetical protein
MEVKLWTVEQIYVKANALNDSDRQVNFLDTIVTWATEIT